MKRESAVLHRLLSPVMAIIGPAAVMTAGIMGAGSTVSLISSGCWFGYSLLWAIFLSLPVIVVCQDTASRIGAASGGKGMMKIIGEQTSVVVMWVIVIPVTLTCISANIGQLGAMAAAMSNLINMVANRELIPAEPNVWVNASLILPLAIISLLVNTLGGYKRIEKLLTYLLFVVMLSFLLVAIQAFMHLNEIVEILKGLIPGLPEDVPIEEGGARSALISFTSIMGGGVAATAILSFPYFTTEGGYTMDNIRARFWKHLLLFGLIFGVYSCILLISGGYALHGVEGSAGFNNARQMGMGLERVLGPAGTIFFSIGLFICGFSTLIVVAQLGTYFILDCLGKNWRFEKSNRLFLIPFALFILGPAFFAVFWNFPNLLKVIISMVFNAVVAPLAIILIIYLINKRSVAGELKASPTRNIFLAYSVGVMSYTSIVAVKGLSQKLAVIFGIS